MTILILLFDYPHKTCRGSSLLTLAATNGIILALLDTSPWQIRMQTFHVHNKRLLILCTFLLVLAGCKMYFSTTTDQFTAIRDPDSFERGKNLVFNVCGGCHYDRKEGKFSGKQMHDLPKIAGRLYSANLTNSTTHGRIPHYSDAELFYLLKTGISRSGRFMPYMMRPMMADKDINDIIVYLRSDDHPVSAADTTVGTTRINLIGKIGIRFLAKPQPYNKGVARPDENDPVSYGRYLVAVIGCYHCHSRRARQLDYFEPEKTRGYLTGGMKLKDPQGNRIFSPNLTPDKETGIGNYTEEQFRKAVTEGIDKTWKELKPPMPKFIHLTPVQVSSIYAYLKSLPPVHRITR